MVNKVFLLGRLGRDPEIRYTSDGKPVASLSIATGSSYTDANGTKRDTTQWHRVVVWGKQAESCQKCLSKGSQAFVEGRLQTRQYDDRDGNKQRITEVVAERVTFLGSKDGSKRNQQTEEDDIPF